jgi:homoserine O-succinyltransferase
MPVFLNSDPERPAGCIRVGLINNMGDEALKATERQYISLLNRASDGLPVNLSFYSLPEIPRNEWSTGHIAALYASVEDLWEGALDGLIVTGREPLAASLIEEPYWDSFTKTLEWAQENAHSTVWSCLAAHAAILHMDGIRRIKRDEKLFGIFECTRETDHSLTEGMAPHFRLPHSRWNGACASDLARHGYTVLTRSAEAGVDTFIKKQKKLFVFFQGHPEYEVDTLLREYRRDVGRYFKGEADKYPPIPANYFDSETQRALSVMQEGAVIRGKQDLLMEITAALETTQIENSWGCGAASVYHNWLRYILAQKSSHSRSVTRFAALETAFEAVGTNLNNSSLESGVARAASNPI